MLDRNSTTSEFLHNLFLQHQVDLIPEIELSSNDLLIDLAKIGLGIAFVPDYCINHENKELFVLKTKEKNAVTPDCCVRKHYNARVSIH